MTEFKKHVESNAGSIYEQIETAKIDEKQQREEAAKKLKQQKAIVQAAFYSIVQTFFEGYVPAVCSSHAGVGFSEVIGVL